MIFCVEDDAGIRELMVYTLNASGFEAVGFPDGAAKIKNKRVPAAGDAAPAVFCAETYSSAKAASDTR